MNRAIQKSALRSNRRTELKQAGVPKAPVLLAPTDPGQALAASINAVSGLLHYINQILSGPMRGAPDFYKQYLRTAAKEVGNCLKQLAVRVDGIPMLDQVAQASVDLLAVAAEADPEAAEALADVLNTYAHQNGFGADTKVEAILAQTQTLSQAQARAEIVCRDNQLWVDVTGSGVLEGTAASVRARIHGTVPLEQLSLILEDVEDVRS